MQKSFREQELLILKICYKKGSSPKGRKDLI